MPPSRLITRTAGGVRSLLSSLSLRLFILLFGTIIVVFSIYAFLNIRSTSRQWQQTVYEGAQRFSDLIQHSTHYSMLLNRKEDVHETINTVGSEPGFVGINIYNKAGYIIFSTDSLITGHQVDMNAEAFPGQPDERSIRSYYERHREDYVQPEKRRIADIQLAPTEAGNARAQSDKLWILLFDADYLCFA